MLKAIKHFPCREQKTKYQELPTPAPPKTINISDFKQYGYKLSSVLHSIYILITYI